MRIGCGIPICGLIVGYSYATELTRAYKRTVMTLANKPNVPDKSSRANPDIGLAAHYVPFLFLSVEENASRTCEVPPGTGDRNFVTLMEHRRQKMGNHSFSFFCPYILKRLDYDQNVYL